MSFRHKDSDGNTVVFEEWGLDAIAVRTFRAGAGAEVILSLAKVRALVDFLTVHIIESNDPLRGL